MCDDDNPQMIELGGDLVISFFLVALLIGISISKDLLDFGGIVAALCIASVVSLLGHWTWLAVLITFLVVGSVATKWRYDEKVLISAEEPNDGVRGWKNVIANGGVAFIVTVVNYYLGGYEWTFFLLCSAISVAASDTLASEVGSLDPRTRIITTLDAVPPGTNGGMSPTGTLAAFYGALLIALVSTILGALNGDRTPSLFLFIFVTVIGWSGCQIDSILGALLENRGYLGKHSVNFISTASGALIALALALRFL